LLIVWIQQKLAFFALRAKTPSLRLKLWSDGVGGTLADDTNSEMVTTNFRDISSETHGDGIELLRPQSHVAD
jgi:hypothetical protein